jgi:hypothetical protein|eukprot:COSAG06_NODE_8355_length_2195_cov_1.312023_3_plen_108_part_00
MQHAFPCMPCGMRRWWRLKDAEEREREVLRASKCAVDRQLHHYGVQCPTPRYSMHRRGRLDHVHLKVSPETRPLTSKPLVPVAHSPSNSRSLNATALTDEALPFVPP